MANQVEFTEALVKLIGEFAIPTIIAVNMLTLLGIFLMFLGRRESFKTYINFSSIKLKKWTHSFLVLESF